MGTVFNHYKTNIRAFGIEERGDQLNAPFQIVADGSYTAVADIELYGPTSSVQLETQSLTSPGGWALVAKFDTSTRPMRPLTLSLKAGTYRVAVTDAGLYSARIWS